MHASIAFLVLALAASAAPSLAAPVYARDVELIFAREVPEQEPLAPVSAPVHAHATHAHPHHAHPHGHAHKHSHNHPHAHAHPNTHLAAHAPGQGSADQSGAFSFGKIFKSIFGRDDVELLTRSDVEEILARSLPPQHQGAPVPGSADQSGAFSFGKLLKGAAKIFFRDEDGNMLSRRDIEELVSRDDFEEIVARALPATQAVGPAGSADQSGAFSFGKLLKGAAKIFFREDGEMLSRREFEELVARDDFEDIVARAIPATAGPQDQQSGAFNFGRLIKGAAKAIFGREFEDELMTRDFDEFFARDDELFARDDEIFARGEELFTREDFEDLLARAAPVPAGSPDQSGAFSFGKLLKGAARLIFREEGEMLSRREIEDILAREAPADQSGAFSFGRLIKGAAKAIFGREEGELMARDFDDLFERDFDDELFARDEELFARDDELYAREDIEDLFARDVPHSPAPVAPVGHPGAPNDQSGALFFGKILRAGAKALFGREEEMYARDDIFEARSLNELD